MLRRNPPDLSTGNPIVAPHLKSSQIQRRSVFPKAVLGRDVPKALQDSILNSAMTRTKIAGVSGQRPPSEYLKETKRALGQKYRRGLDAHLLPSGDDNGLFRDDFQAFLNERIGIFAAEIEQLTGVPCQRTPDTTPEPSKSGASRRG